MKISRVSAPSWRALIGRYLSRWTPAKMQTAIRKTYYSRYLESIAQSETDLVVVKGLVEAGSCVLDIGANVGAYTLALSRLVGPAGQVYSFEPVPLTFAILKNDVDSFQLHNVRLFDVALSDCDGTVVMEIPEWDDGRENYYQSRIVNPDTGNGKLAHVMVQSRPLDGVVAELKIKKLGFVKVDVEGHELKVLRGGESTLRRHRPALLVEVSGNPDKANSQAQELFGLLTGIGYEPYWFDGSRLRKRNIGDNSVNYFFLTKLQFDDYIIRCGH